MPGGLTSKWVDWTARLAHGGHIPLRVTEDEEFRPWCERNLESTDVDAVRIAIALVSNLYNKTCRDLIGNLLKSGWIDKVFELDDEAVVDLCILLTRQLPTAVKTRESVLAARVGPRFRPRCREKANLLKYYLDATSEADLGAEIEELQSTAYDLGLISLALLPASAITNGDELEVHLGYLQPHQLEKLASVLGLEPTVDDFICRYSRIEPDRVTSRLSPHRVVDSGVYLSIEDYNSTQLLKLDNDRYDSATKQVQRMNAKLETGTYRYGAPAQFREMEFLPANISQTRRVVYQVEIDPDDLSENGKREFAGLLPGQTVVVGNQAAMWTALVRSPDPLLVECDAQKVEFVIIPLDAKLFAQPAVLPTEWPEFLVRPLLGWGYRADSAIECAEFIEKNPLAVLAVPPGGDLPPLDWAKLGRSLIVSPRAKVAGAAHIYCGESLVPRLESLLQAVAALAVENELGAFYKSDWPTARLVGRRLGLLESALFRELEWLSPLQVLDESQHANYLLRSAQVVVSQEPLSGAFETVVIDHAEQWSELSMLQVLSPGLTKLILVGSASPQPSLFSRLIDYGAHFSQPPLDVAPALAQLFSDWYPTLSATGSDILPGFAQPVQSIFVGGYGVIVPNEQHVGTAEYAVLLYQYLVLLGYPAERICLVGQTFGQNDLISEIAMARNCGEAPFGRQPRVGVPAAAAADCACDVIVYSAVWGNDAVDERTACWAKKGAFFLIPADVASSLEVIVGELVDRVLEQREATPLVGLRHLADYVKEMTQQRLSWGK